MNIIPIIIHIMNESEKKFLLSLPADEHRQLKALAAQRETSMKALITAGIRAVLSESQPLKNHVVSNT